MSIHGTVGFMVMPVALLMGCSTTVDAGWSRPCNGAEPRVPPLRGDHGGGRRALLAVEDVEGHLGYRFVENGLFLFMDHAESVFPWPYHGAYRWTWRVSQRLIRLNGRPVGLDLRGLPADTALRRIQHRRGSIRLVLLRSHQLRPRLTRQLRNIPRLVLTVDGGGRDVVPLDRVARLGRNLVGLSIQEGLLRRGALRHLGELPGLRALSLRSTPVGRRDLQHLGRQPRIEALDLSGTGLGDADLALLASLRRLRVLDLSYNPIQGDGLASLQTLLRLRQLSLTCCGLTDSGPGHLSRLRSLRALDLSINPITDFGLARLGGLGRLEALDLTASQITDLGLALLRRWPALRQLRLPHHVSDVGLVQLTGLGRLAVLGLRRAAVTDQGLSTLARLTTLHSLDLAGTAITDQGLAHLGGLRWLEMLDLGQTAVCCRFDLLPRGLRVLRIRGTDVARAGLRRLAHLQALEVLDLAWNPHLARQGLTAVLPLCRLRRLVVDGTGVSGGELARFRLQRPDCRVVWRAQ